MTVESVIGKFARYSGMTYEDAEEWSDLAEIACAQIGARTRDIDTENDEEMNELLESAAAALAFYQYKAIEASRRDVTSFKAGDVSLELGGGGAEDAFRMYQSSLDACSKLLDRSEFVFGRMDSICTEN